MSDVFVVDDDEMVANNWALQLEDLGFHPEVVTDIPRNLDDFIRSVKARDGSVILDQRLSGRVHSAFRGSDFAIALYDAEIPNILTTAHLEQELPFLRHLQRRMPAVYSRKGLRDVDIRVVLSYCRAEFADGPSESRKPYRSLVRVTDVYPEANLSEVVVPAWDPLQNVLVSMQGFPEPLTVGLRFFSDVNLGARDIAEIYFDGFAIAAPPDGDDGLG